MKRNYLLSLMLSLLCLMAWADRIDLQVAKEIAQTVAKGYNTGALRTSSQPPTLVYAAAAGQEGSVLRSGTTTTDVDYYIFNIGSQHGFIIVAGEDRAHPVLGYSDTGTFDPDHIPSNLRGMLAFYQKEIDYAVRTNMEASETIRSEWNRLTSGLSLRAESAEVILHTAKWNQGTPYNNHTPMEGSEHTLTGCVATSTGILLQYCQYPVQLQNGVSVYYGIPISYRPYNWELMPQDQPDTDTEIEEVSTLLWHIGANVEMDYGLYGSSAVNMKAVEFLQNNAQFNKGTRYLEREDFYWDEWKNMIRRTLNGQEYGQGYPLLYRGSGNAGGHMFIIDGYGPEEYFHVNWGWGGHSDGNFVLTALNTNSGNFSEECGMIYAAVPQTKLDKDDIELRFRSLVLSGKVEPSAPFSVRFRCINTGNVQANYLVGVGVYDKDGNLKSTIHQDSYYCNLKSNYFTTFGLTCNISESLSSTDQIVPIYKVTESDPEWHRMPNAPAAPLYINGIGEYISDTDTPTDPTLIPINHYYNRQTDCYIKVENGLDGILYNSSQTISLNMTGQRGNKTMRYKIKDYDGWKDHVRAFYSNRNFDNSSQGTELSISEDGIFTIAINESEYDDAFMSDLMVCSDQRGVLNYELNITDDNTGSAQYSLSDGTMHIVQEMAITPSDIAGNVNSEIPFTVNITNIDPALYGKQMGATIGLSNAANRGIVVKYEGTIVNCQQQDDDLYGDFVVSTLPAESTHTLNFTIQSAQTLTSDDNVTVFVYSHQYPYVTYSTPLIISAAETIFRQVTTSWTHITCDWTGTQVEDGGQLTLHLTPDEGYDLPDEVSVTMGSVELTDVYDRSAGTITIENVTGDLNITGSAVKKQYTVKFTLQNIQPIEDKSVSHGGMVIVTLTAATNYKLPTSITVKQGETILERGEDYLYLVLLGNMGHLHIQSVKGDIEVIAVGVPKNSYEVAMSLDHLTTDSEINNIVGGEPINCKLTPATGYRLPATIEIKMGETTLTAGTEYTYSPESGEISIPNVTGAIQITAAAELITFTINQDLNGLSLTPDPEPIGYGGTYEGTLSLTDPENNKLPESITVKQSNGDESWTDYTYDPSTGKVTIQNLTAELIIQASSVLLNDYSISTVLDHISVSGLPEGNTIKEGKKLTLNLTAEEDYKLPNTIQIKQDGEALSADTYTYDATTGEVVIQQVKGDITILASGIDQHNYEVELHLTNITSTLDNNSFFVNTQVEFTLNANTGYTLPAELTVTMGGTALVADVDYSYNPANGQFSLRAITGPLSITAMAVPNNYGAATYQLSHITLGGYTEHAVYGSIYECQLTADEGYELPASIQIKMAGALLETGYTYEYGLIRILSVTGPITIKAEATLKSYAVTAELSHLGSDLTADKKVRHGESLTVQLQAAEGYKLPASVTVKMSDTPLTSDAFSYDPTNGIIQITAVTGPVEITASGVLKVSYTVTTDLNNVTADIESGYSILEGSSLKIHLTVEEGFELPSSVTLQQGEKTLVDGTDFTYDKSSGDLVINSVQGNLTLTVHGIDTRHYEVLLTMTGLNTDPAVIAPILHGEKLVFKLVAEEGYRLPETLSSVKVGDTPVSADDYTYDATTGEFQMNDITQKVSIEAIGQRIYYSVNATLQDLNSDLTEDQKVAYGESLRISFSVGEGFVLPKSVTVKMGGETLTTGYTYENGVLTINAVKGNIEVIASALKKVIVNEETKELEGEIPSIEVKTDGNVELTLGDIVNDHLEVGSNSEANIKVTADSKIDELKNIGTATLSSNGSSKLKLQTIDNSGILVLDESLKLESVPETVSNSGSFTDNTGTIKKVEGSAALELTVTPPAQNTYTQGQRFTLTVKATVSTSRQKTVFEWQKKRNNNWERVHADERSLSLRSDAVEELTSTYTLPQNDQGDYRCVVSNVVDAEKQTTLLTETAVSLRTSDPGPEPEPDPTPTPDPDPEPDPTPIPDPIPTPDPTPTFKVTIPQVEGTSVHTYGSSYVEKGKSFSFRINIAEGYNAKDLVVKANGAVLLPDASGLYVIGDIQDNVVVTITGIVKESPSANEGPGYTMTSVWTAHEQIHIHLGQDATITVSDYNGRIVKRFKGTVGDYHISVHEGSYVVSVDGLRFKVVL